MSGIRNIKQLAKKYKQAEIYFHIDLDGVTSALAMKEYLNRYGIKVVAAHKLNYGSDEYNIFAPKEGNMGVMVDFSHGKPFIQIHTDHHQEQIVYNESSTHFRHSKSNASTISSIIGNGIFSSLDEKAIDMIDSASFAEYDIKPKDVGNAVFKLDNNVDKLRQHLNMALACNKLLLTYKNKMDWLVNIVLKCKPSLVSIYNQLMKWIIDNNKEDCIRFKLPNEINDNVEKYFEEQNNKSYTSNNLNDITLLRCGQSLLIGDCIIQVGGGYMKRVGSYERYTAYRIFPQAKYFIMIWDEIGMMQISKNPWNSNVDEKIDLGKLVLNDLFLEQYAKTDWLKDKTVSMLALKAEFEKNIDLEKEKYAVGFNMSDFEANFKNCGIDFEIDPDRKINKSMSLRMSKYWCENMSSARAEQSLRMIKFMNNQRVSLIGILKKLSGGHKAITNLTGLNLLNRQLQIDIALEKNDNPFRPLTDTEKEELALKKKNDSYVVKLMKNFAKEVVKKLNALD